MGVEKKASRNTKLNEMNVMAKLIPFIDDKRGPFSHGWFCPACGCGHGVNLDPGREAPLWTLTGTLEKPTIRASILVRSDKHCHVYITDGMIQYLSDCSHAMAGQTVPMEDY